MKKVFASNNEVCHVFAQRTYSEGRASNIFFYGDKIYSYGYHYLLAEFTELNGETVVIINDKGYSSSTAKHIHIIIGTTSQYKQYFTTDFKLPLVFNRILSATKKLAKARKPYNYIKDIKKDYETLIASPFHTENDKQDSMFIAMATIYNSINAIDTTTYIEALKQVQIKKDKEDKERHEQSIFKFRNYEIDNVWGDKIAMRISSDGNTIETSQGVRIDITEARTLFSKIQSKEPIKGFKIGYYTVNGIQGSNLMIGCHTIPMKEVMKVGNQL
jgi:hypothetical protein